MSQIHPMIFMGVGMLFAASLAFLGFHVIEWIDNRPQPPRSTPPAE